MTTTRITVAVLALMMSASLGCGSKNKKKADTTTTTTTTADSDRGGDKQKGDVTKGDTSSDPANLTDTIYFEFDQSELGAEARAALDENAAWAKENPARELLIEGHTDETGTNEYNLALGDRRARAAKDYLTALGVEERRIKIITYGEERPASNEDSMNRRSVFVATKQ
ncbi:MAG TPA: OmpA family protein [Kofleriaceae bacterium]|nr:OmpA family protein [Kofleriaceae bacterium]